MKRIITTIFIVSCCYTSVFAQTTPTPGLKGTVNALNDLRERLPIEKLYLQLDKPYYSLGDTLRFKAYLLNTDFLTPSTQSSMLYVELDDVAGRTVKRIMVPLASGISWGDMALNADNDIDEGSYTLRAYTNWMRNFGEDYIFKKSIYISALSGSTLVKADFRLDSLNGKNKVQASLRFTNMERDALRLKDMQLRVMNGRRTLIRDKVTTGMDGSMAVNFDLADKTSINNLSIRVQNLSKDADTSTLTIPVTINRPENTDVQFMPEGGNMVAGISSKIGFKAIAEDGKSVAVKGIIYNNKQQEVVKFATAHAGMGSFEMTPQSGESYIARVTLPGNIIKNYLLPAVSPTGSTLRVSADNDSLEVMINATAGATKDYYLIGQARGVVCYAAHVTLNNGKAVMHAAKNVFPTGVARFTLLSNTNQPLNERIVFIDHKDNLQINIAANQQNYTIRDSIALNLQVNDKDGKPVQGAFSLAVTDDSQVRTDSLGGNMINNLLFTSDLKGTVEEPGWYFENTTTERLTALDNLLLTQGWVGYDWQDVFGPKTEPKYLAEKEFIIEGKVTNVFNKPVANSGIVLFSQKPEVIRDTVTGKDGRFIFKGFYPIDTAIFKIQARNKSGKSFNVGIEMLNEFKSPVFTATRSISPWYVNSDTVLLNNSNTKQAQLKAQADYSGEGNQLKEVVIKAKKIIKDSHNLNGPGEYDEALDEKDMLKAGKMTLEEVLKSKIKGFMVRGGIWLPCNSCGARPLSYMVYDKMAHFVIDGIDLNQISDVSWMFRKLGPFGEPGRYNYLRPYLDNLTAEDIKGIEVMYNPRYTNNYETQLFTGSTGITSIDLFVSEAARHIVYIEITTRAGKGPYARRTPGTYLYKPLPFTLPKEFYRPRYTAKNSNTAVGTDLRSTIHWEPNVVTDSLGKVTVSFFSADKPADYTVIMEGTDLEGNIGYHRQKIKVIAKPTTVK